MELIQKITYCSLLLILWAISFCQYIMFNKIIQKTKEKHEEELIDDMVKAYNSASGLKDIKEFIISRSNGRYE